MRAVQNRGSLGERTAAMSLTWLSVGALVGAIGGLRSGSAVELVSGMVGGMVVLPVAGAFLGVIGGDAGGSLVGAIGGLLGSWLAAPISGIAVDAPTTRFMVLFGALAGATCLLYLHIKLWIYEKLWAAAWKGVALIPVRDHASRQVVQGGALRQPHAVRAHLGTASLRIRP
jgi:hypothetical protein